MQTKMIIEWNWVCDSGIAVPDKHAEALEEDAKERIFEMIADGYSSGELSTSVRYGADIVPEEDEDSGLEYSGSWKVTYER